MGLRELRARLPELRTRFPSFARVSEAFARLSEAFARGVVTAFIANEAISAQTKEKPRRAVVLALTPRAPQRPASPKFCVAVGPPPWAGPRARMRGLRTQKRAPSEDRAPVSP